MSSPSSNSDALYELLLANSIFTPRQLSIILTYVRGVGGPKSISSGAYYRQVRQCRKKINSLLFSIILLQAMGIVKLEGSVTLSKVSEQLAVIFSSEDSDNEPITRTEGVISVINELIKRISLV
ncbi:MAG: hypothetical protein ACJ70N_05300 [Nitrososphaera sp.]